MTAAALTLFAPRIGYYATFAAPPTIRETLSTARDRFDLDLPMADLFTWGTDADAIASVTSGFRVGTETIGGQRCEHFAMRQDRMSTGRSGSAKGARRCRASW